MSLTDRHQAVRQLIDSAEFRNLSRFGVEFEGGWEDDPPAGVGRDGSVHVEANIVGEVRTEPIPCTKEGLRTLVDWVEKNHPDRVDYSCGLHIHTSFIGDRDGAGLYAASQRLGLLKAYRRWVRNWAMSDVPGLLPLKVDHRFWSRWRGENQYAGWGYHPTPQMSEVGYGSCRYEALNWSWAKHKTLENRLFPMFVNADVSLHAIISYLLWLDRMMDSCVAKMEWDIQRRPLQLEVDRLSRPGKRTLDEVKVEMSPAELALYFEAGSFDEEQEKVLYDLSKEEICVF